MESCGEIFIVVDDASARHALRTVFVFEHYNVRMFADGESLVLAARTRLPACILLDIGMPGRLALRILKELNADRYPAPILIILRDDDIPTAVEAIKQGAFDIIEGPFDAHAVVKRVREAIAARARRVTPARVSEFHDLLTPRECEVLEQIVSGASNKEAAHHLGISHRTIEVHRARIMTKLGAKNAADVARIVLGPRRRKN